jgi:hypothetical protein
LINLDNFTIVGPGSEWFWVMAQFLALALTGLAILRQLHAQRSAALYEQMSSWAHEFAEPRMTRHKLALMLAIEHREPRSGLPRANDEVPDFFERLGYLISRGHVRLEDVWADQREIVGFYWGVLAPYIEHERDNRGDPTIYQSFEWLELQMRRLDKRRLRRSRVFDPSTRTAAIADRIAVMRIRLDREREAWPDEIDLNDAAAIGQHATRPRATTRRASKTAPRDVGEAAR